MPKIPYSKQIQKVLFSDIQLKVYTAIDAITGRKRYYHKEITGGQASASMGHLRDFNGQAEIPVLVRTMKFTLKDRFDSYIKRLHQFNSEYIVHTHAYGFERIKGSNNAFMWTVAVAMVQERCTLSDFYDNLKIRNKDASLHLGMVYFFIMDIARGLKYLHDQGLFHGDLCPSNVVVSALGVCKLIDFQGVRVVDTSFTIVQGGKQFYVDNLNGDHGWYTDVFSLGQILLFLLTGTVDDRPLLRTDDDISTGLCELIQMCCKPDSMKLERCSIAEFIEHFTALFKANEPGQNMVWCENNTHITIYQTVATSNNLVVSFRGSKISPTNRIETHRIIDKGVKKKLNVPLFDFNTLENGAEVDGDTLHEAARMKPSFIAKKLTPPPPSYLVSTIYKSLLF